MKIAIVGLGLIGGSICKALKKSTFHHIMGLDADEEVCKKALDCGAIDEIISERKAMPEIFMACGTEDFLLENNRDFHRFLEDRKVPHHYYESKGGHDTQFWDEYAVKFVHMMFGGEERKSPK